MSQQPDSRRSLDTGLAFTLLALLAYYLLPGKGPVLIATVLLLLCMTVPWLFTPFARVWFALGERLSALTSALLLVMVFLLVVTPIGIIRRLLGRDPLRLGEWRSGSDTLLQQRKHRWQAHDLEKPY